MTILDTKLMHPRDQIILVIDRIYKLGLTTTSGGNISIIDENGDIWVTPSAVDKGSLQPRDIMCVKQDGSIIGPHKPSSEFPFHKAIYECRPDINAIVHAHPPALVSFSIVRQIPNTNIIPQAKHICGPIGYAPYALPGSEALGESIANIFKDNYNAVIMENHGTVIGGSNLRDAFQRFEALEFCARTIIYSEIIGEPSYLDDQVIDKYVSQESGILPEMETVTHPSDERELRESMVGIVQRACRQGLMIRRHKRLS